jgi:hypothetical protein
MSTYTTLEKIACLDRELALRRNVYAARIRQGKMRADTAQREIGLMEAIREDYWVWHQSQSSTAAPREAMSGSVFISDALLPVISFAF